MAAATDAEIAEIIRSSMSRWQLGNKEGALLDVINALMELHLQVKELRAKVIDGRY